MARLKSDRDIVKLREGGQKLARILKELSTEARVGVTTRELDQIARRLISDSGAEPSFLNYRPEGAIKPFPAALCVSVNDEVVHGMPGDRVLNDGDIVSLDLGLKYQGMFTDMAVTVPVGRIKPEAAKLIETTREALMVGISAAKVGARLGDIGAVIEAVAKQHGYGVVRELGGHGVGFAVHEEPQVANFGRVGTGVVLEQGMVLALEPMFNLGKRQVVFEDDGYTVRTADGSLSAHFEHTIVITSSGAEVLTTVGEVV